MLEFFVEDEEQLTGLLDVLYSEVPECFCERFGEASARQLEKLAYQLNGSELETDIEIVLEAKELYRSLCFLNLPFCII